MHEHVRRVMSTTANLIHYKTVSYILMLFDFHCTICRKVNGMHEKQKLISCQYLSTSIQISTVYMLKCFTT